MLAGPSTTVKQAIIQDTIEEASIEQQIKEFPGWQFPPHRVDGNNT